MGATTRKGKSNRKSELQLNLVENGIDFVREGARTFFSREEAKAAAHKYGILHIFSGVLLILKERLRLAHPSLIFTRVHVQGADAATVTFDELLLRLQGAAGVSFASDQVDLLRRAQTARNRIEHYEVKLDLKDAKKLIGDLVSFAFKFLREELKVKLEDHLDKPTQGRLAELQEVAKQLHKEDHERWVEKAKKYFELTDDGLEEVASSAAGDPREGAPDRFYECPECGDEALVFVAVDIAVCTNRECREVMRLGECEDCGTPALSSLCRNCSDYRDYLMSKDD